METFLGANTRQCKRSGTEGLKEEQLLEMFHEKSADMAKQAAGAARQKKED